MERQEQGKDNRILSHALRLGATVWKQFIIFELNFHITVSVHSPVFSNLVKDPVIAYFFKAATISSFPCVSLWLSLPCLAWTHPFLLYKFFCLPQENWCMWVCVVAGRDRKPLNSHLILIIALDFRFSLGEMVNSKAGICVVITPEDKI